MPGIGKQVIKKGGAGGTASAISYSNTTSGLASTTVQGAIDESINLSIAMAVAL